MKNETIKTITTITVEQAAKLQSEGATNLLLSQNGKYFDDETTLDAIAHDDCSCPFYCDRTQSFFKTCATVTELDPCQAPDGCPELEPWMAYVGLGKDIPASNGEYYVGDSTVDWGGGMDSRPSEANDKSHYAIDVRTSFAQEHFSEHVRIRNYQEPNPMQEAWDKQLRCFHTISDAASFKQGWAAATAHMNPQPTK